MNVEIYQALDFLVAGHREILFFSASF